MDVSSFMETHVGEHHEDPPPLQNDEDGFRPPGVDGNQCIKLSNIALVPEVRRANLARIS